MKKIISVIVIIVILISVDLTYINADVIPVFYNGERLVFDVDPVVIDDRTMVPMRTIFETFGAKVSYDPQTKQITGIKGSLKIILNVGISYATVSRNGMITEYTLDAPPKIIEGRTVVPLRFIGEALGASVNWIPADRSVTIITSPQTDNKETADDTQTGKVMTATEIGMHMQPRSVVIICYNSSGQSIRQGSGFIIDPMGYIVTNYHVIKGAARAVARMSDGSEHEIVSITHYNEGRDLAVVRINKSNLLYVNLGDSSIVETGNKVFAYGSPLGVSNTLSEGIISNKDVVIDGYQYIQISAPVSSGSSGGAVVDEKGSVIGVVCAYLINAQNMNLAIPVNDLKALLNEVPVDLPFDSLASVDDQERITFYESEPNNRISTAQHITANCYVLGAYASAGFTSDLDYYRITITNPGWLDVVGIWSSEQLQDIIYTQDLRIAVVDANDKFIAFAADKEGSSLNSYKSISVYLNPGTYYILVFANYEYRYLYAGEYYYFGVWFD